MFAMRPAMSIATTAVMSAIVYRSPAMNCRPASSLSIRSSRCCTTARCASPYSGNCRSRSLNIGWVVADGLADRPEQLELHAPVPHLDLGLLARVAAHQIGLGVLPFEIAADRHRFGDAAAVVELQHRQPARRVL